MELRREPFPALLDVGLMDMISMAARSKLLSVGDLQLGRNVAERPLAVGFHWR